MLMSSKTIFICTSPQISTLTTYFIELGRQFLKRNYTVIILFDKREIRNDNPKGLIYEKWPSYRPTQYKDLVFLSKLIKAYKPSHIISSFGSVNVAIISGFLLGVKHRVAWYHTKSIQLRKDSSDSGFKFFFLRIRKALLLNLFATELHTNSTSTASDAIEYLRYPKKKIKVIGFLLSNLFHVKKTEKSDIISFVGRFSPSKGQMVMVRAIKLILKEHPNYKIYFVGSGSTENKIKEIVQNNIEIKDSVVFTGSIKQNAVYAILQKSKLHVSASEDEAFGLVNVEALACGTPILAHKVGGITDILENGKNGYFFRKNDSVDLANKINKILSDTQLYSSLVDGAKLSFNKQFCLNEKNLNKKVDLILA